MWAKQDIDNCFVPKHNRLNQQSSPPTQAGVDPKATVRVFTPNPPAWNPPRLRNPAKTRNMAINQLHRGLAPLSPQPNLQARRHGTEAIAQNRNGEPVSCYIWAKNTMAYHSFDVAGDHMLNMHIQANNGIIYNVRSVGFTEVVVYLPNVDTADDLVTKLRQAFNQEKNPISLDVEVYPITADQALHVLQRADEQTQVPPRPIPRVDTVGETFRNGFEGQLLIHGCVTPCYGWFVGSPAPQLINDVARAIRKALSDSGVTIRNMHFVNELLHTSDRPMVAYLVELQQYEDADGVMSSMFRIATGQVRAVEVELPRMTRNISLWGIHFHPRALVPPTLQDPLPRDYQPWSEVECFRQRQFGNIAPAPTPVHPLHAGYQPGATPSLPRVPADDPTNHFDFDGASSSQQTTPTQEAVSAARQAMNNRFVSSEDMLRHQTGQNFDQVGHPTYAASAAQVALPSTPDIPPYQLDLNDDPTNFSLDGHSGQAGGHNAGHAPGNNIIRRFLMDGSEVRCTVMFRALPGDMNVHTFIRFLNYFAFGQYRFVYVRKDFSTGKNVGYAFVDFISPMSVITFLDYALGEVWPGTARKRIEMSFATVQGVEALIERFRNSVVMTEPEEHRPRLFHAFPDPLAGMQMPFPACDNQQKLWRSIHSAQDVGLFPNGKRQSFSRRGHLDPGNPRGELQRSYERICQENRMMRGMLARGRGGRGGTYA